MPEGTLDSYIILRINHSFWQQYNISDGSVPIFESSSWSKFYFQGNKDPCPLDFLHTKLEIVVTDVLISIAEHPARSHSVQSCTPLTFSPLNVNSVIRCKRYRSPNCPERTEAGVFVFFSSTCTVMSKFPRACCHHQHHKKGHIHLHTSYYHSTKATHTFFLSV